MNNHYTTTHNSWDPNLVVPFAGLLTNANEVYVDPMWGIKIARITADGIVVPPLDYDVDLDDRNLNKVSVQFPFIYLIRFQGLHFAKTFSEKEYQLEKYEIPQNAKKIRIEYHFRESNEALGPMMTLESFLVK